MSKTFIIRVIASFALLGLLAACAPTIPLTGGSAQSPTLVNTVAVPTSAPATAAPVVITVVVTATPPPAAAPATATQAPTLAAPTMAMSMPTAAPQTAPQQPAPAQPSVVNGVMQVSIANFAFSPATLTVPVGTKVRWTNRDSTAHTVTANSGTFDSGPLNPGQTFAVSFSQAGTYTYHCKIHPNMVGTVIVTGGAVAPKPSSGSSGGMNGSSGGSSGGNMGGGSGGGGGFHY